MPSGVRVSPHRIRGLRLFSKDTFVDLGIIVVAWCGLFGGYLFAGWMLPRFFGDMLVLTRPFFSFTAENLLHGVFPLWNPYTNFPNFAAGCSGVLYPTTPLYGLFDFPIAFKWDFVLHWLLLGGGCYLLGLRWFRARSASLILALLAMSSPYLLAPSYGGNIWQIRMFAWLPLVLLLFCQLLSTGQTRWALMSALILTLQLLAGDSQMFLFEAIWLGVGVAIALAYRLCILRELPRRVLCKASLCLSAVVLALMLGAIQWLPGAELMATSIRRQGVTLNFIATVAGFRNANFLNNCLAFLTFNSPEGERNYVFAGPIVASLFLMGLCGRWNYRRVILGLALMFAMAFCLWPETPMAGLFSHLPFVGQARVPVRMFNYAIFAAYLFAAWAFARISGDAFARISGDAHLACEAPETKRRMRWPLPVLCILVGLYTFHLMGKEASISFVAMSSLALCLLAVLCARLKRTGNVAALILLSMGLGVECFVSHYNGPRHEYSDAYAPSPAYAQFSRAREGLDRVAVFCPRAFESYGLPLEGALRGDRMLGFNHTLMLGDYTQWLSALTPIELAEFTPDGLLDADKWWNIYAQDWVCAKSVAALDLLNVRYLVTKEMPLAYVEADIAAGGTRFRKYAVGDLAVYENRRVMPPAFTVHAAQSVASLEEAIATLKRTQFDYTTTACVLGAFDASLVQPSEAADRVEVERYGVNDVTIRASMRAAGLLALTDVYYPGWNVTVDGLQTEILQVDGILRGAFVPAGEHLVQFRFQPQSFRRGAAISFVGWSIVLAASCALWWNGRRSAHTSPA